MLLGELFESWVTRQQKQGILLANAVGRMLAGDGSKGQSGESDPMVEGETYNLDDIARMGGSIQGT
jgi:hypothetical protein